MLVFHNAAQWICFKVEVGLQSVSEPSNILLNSLGELYCSPTSCQKLIIFLEKNFSCIFAVWSFVKKQNLAQLLSFYEIMQVNYDNCIFVWGEAHHDRRWKPQYNNIRTIKMIPEVNYNNYPKVVILLLIKKIPFFLFLSCSFYCRRRWRERRWRGNYKFTEDDKSWNS